jgi:signal transduction histidine kinase/putative methionine-R-sulfoxide reductase with GAF domain
MRKSQNPTGSIQEKLKELQRLLRKREKELYSIQRVSKAVGSTLNIDRLLLLIMREITVLMEAERSTLYIVDHEKNELWAKVAIDAEISEIRQIIGKGISGTVALTGETINLQDVYADPRFDPVTDLKTGYRTNSMLCMPVWEPSAQKGKRRIIAVIQVLNKQSGVFTEEDEELLGALSAQIAISINNARLYQQLERKLKEMDLLYELEQILSIEHQIDEVIKKILVKSLSHFRAKWALCLLPEKEAYHFYGIDSDKKFFSQLLSSKKIDFQGNDLNPAESRKLVETFAKLLNKPDILASVEQDLYIAPIHAPTAPNGVLIIASAAVSSAAYFRDEKNFTAMIAQKISRATELFQLRESIIKQERLSAIGGIISTVIHDIRSPIGTIQGFVELMEDESTTAEERHEFAAIIREEIRSAMNMITEVLDFAKGKTSILPRKSTAQNLLKRFLPRLEKMCETTHTRLTVSNESNQIIYVDEEKLLRVFYNIAKNAIEAMGENGALAVRAFDDKDWVIFEIKDSGPGVPEEIRHKLFDSFVTSGKKGGTGLGLAIVKKIVEEHKGKVEIDSKTGNGVTFRIKIPIQSSYRTKAEEYQTA